MCRRRSIQQGFMNISVRRPGLLMLWFYLYYNKEKTNIAQQQQYQTENIYLHICSSAYRYSSIIRSSMMIVDHLRVPVGPKTSFLLLSMALSSNPRAADTTGDVNAGKLGRKAMLMRPSSFCAAAPHLYSVALGVCRADRIY